MRLTKRHRSEVTETDMTPMIDMTFQLIAFLMVMINFSDIEQDQRVQLPSSELAKPPETAYDEPLTIQMTSDETILFGGQEMDIDQLRAALRTESRLLADYKTADGRSKLSQAMVVIRADLRSRTGSVQEIIAACQEAGFDTFALRGKQSDEPTLNSE